MNNNINLIGINGLIGSGKDTVGKIIQYWTEYGLSGNGSCLEWLNTPNIFINRGLYPSWQVKKFASKLKEMCSILTGIPVEKFEDQDFKKTNLGEEWSAPILGEDWKDGKPINVPMTVRELLQKVGTDLFRDQLHPNVWINALFSDWKPISDIKTSNTYTDERLQHGYKNTKIWRTYHNIKQRCNNPKHPRYIDYGERGIKMCEEWENSITSFINWAKENGYNDSLTIDRINNDENYSPDNCRCVSYSTQAINTKLRRDNTSGYKGVSKDKHNWRADIQINKKQYFLGYFNSAEQASEAYEEKFLERENLYEVQEEKNLIYPSWLITDLRFTNEAEAIKDRGGICVRVNRFETQTFYNPNVSFPDGIPIHASERALDDYPFDYEITNKGSIEELIEEVRKMLQHFKIIE
jgi:hypothetical protein